MRRVCVCVRACVRLYDLLFKCCNLDRLHALQIPTIVTVIIITIITTVTLSTTALT